MKKRHISLAYFPMRAFGVSFLALLSIFVALAQSQATAAEPQFRPALVGNGPKALVNLIDTNKLVKKGQGDGAVSFQCFVSAEGWLAKPFTYRDTPKSQALDSEVMLALHRCRFIPAIYNGKPTAVFFVGTVLFFVTDGKPHLRIYANQNRDDIAKGNDFIAPQMITATSNWERANKELPMTTNFLFKGVAELATTVDAKGNVKGSKVLSEDPHGLNLGHATVTACSTAKYIPGFRNGRPVDCTFNWDSFFWKSDK